jgi:hypothetical protein
VQAVAAAAVAVDLMCRLGPAQAEVHCLFLPVAQQQQWRQQSFRVPQLRTVPPATAATDIPVHILQKWMLVVIMAGGHVVWCAVKTTPALILLRALSSHVINVTVL